MSYACLLSLESYAGFNSLKPFISKLLMCDLDRFSKIQSHIGCLLLAGMVSEAGQRVKGWSNVKFEGMTWMPFWGRTAGNVQVVKHFDMRFQTIFIVLVYSLKIYLFY